MLSLANSILIKHATHKREKLKNFFYEVNNRLCSPTPLPDNEIKIIWRDALGFSDEIIKNIQIVSNDQNDPCNYNSQIIVPLEQGDKLLEQETIQNFVYDIRTESISCDFNHKIEPKKIIFRVNLKEWDKARKTFQKLLEEKGLPNESILLLLEALDNNYELIKQKYFENKTRQDAITQQRELRRKERLQLQAEATDFLMTTYRFATIEESKDILYYDSTKGVYVYGGEILIEKELDKKYGYRLKTADITEIKNYIMRKTYRVKKEFDKDLDTINIENGLLNIQLGQLTPHTADYLSINQKPMKYNPDAKPVKFLKFLEEVLYPEDIPTALEIISYTFIRINLFEHWFILIGGGANGKNVFIGIVSHLHSLKNISNVPIIVLGNPHHRFALAQLENKDINVDTELTAKSYNDLSTLKKITGRQPVNLERKGKDPYDAELWAKQLMSCNELPPSNDNTDARYRREIILQFPNQFEEDPKDDPKIKLADPHLLNKIINDPEEMSGILNLIIKSVKSIYDNKKIHVNSTIAERRAKAQLTYDPVQAFLDTGWMRSESDYMLKDDFYGEFVDFCNKNRLHVLSYDLFAKALRKKEYDNARKTITDNVTGEKKKETVWYVIFLKDNEEEQE